jgi:hypothetical protein
MNECGWLFFTNKTVVFGLNTLILLVKHLGIISAEKTVQK